MTLYTHEPDVLLDDGERGSLLYTALRDYTHIDTIDLKHNIHGKPYIDGIEFSVTHTRGLWMCIIGSHAVGIDAERKDRVISDERCIAIAERFFSKDETAWIRDSANIKEDFFYVWTRKEAYVKYLGTGLSDGIDLFNVIEMDGFNSIPISTKVEAVYYTKEISALERLISI